MYIYYKELSVRKNRILYINTHVIYTLNHMRSLSNDFYTTNAGHDEGVLEVKLTAYAPKEKEGTGHAFLEGLHSGYINVILQSI